MKFSKLLSLTLSFIMLLSVISFALPTVMAAGTESTFGNGTIYYVDSSNGNDSSNGTSEATAWKSLANVNSKTFNAGDTILLKRGCAWTDTFLWPKGSGALGNPITVSCYGDENGELPTITSVDNYDNTASGVPAVNACVYLANQDYVVIENLNIISSTVTVATNGIRILNRNGFRTKGNIIRNCIISKVTTGINVDAENYYGYIGSVTIENNELNDCKGVGINVNGAYSGCNSKGVVNSQSATNVVVRDNYLSTIGKDGILVNNCNHPLVEYNVVNNSHAYAKTSWHVAIWDFACYNAVFQYNEAYNTQTVYDGQGYDCDYQSYYTTFQYNYSHDNTGGFMLICTEPTNWDGSVAFNYGSIVRYNISQNDKSRTFTLTGHITDTKIYNNTFYNDAVDTEYFLYTYSRNGTTWAINTQFTNNICYINSGKFSWNNCTGTVWKNNILYGTAGSYAPLNDEDGGDYDTITASGNIEKDPLLVNAGGASIGIDTCVAYKLYEGSPAVAAGLVISDDINKDFFGNAVSDTEAPNIGACNITIKPTLIYGDVNSDGSVNSKDALVLKQYIANWDVSINIEAADVNLDSSINSKDALLIKQFIANWDVKLGK